MAVDFHLVPALRHLAVGADEIRCPHDAHVGAAVVRLLLPHAVLLRDLVVGVGQQRKGDVVFRGELRLARFVEDADAEDDRLARLETRQVVAKVAGFLRAAGRIVFGVEIQHDRLAGLISERRWLSPCWSLRVKAGAFFPGSIKGMLTAPYTDPIVSTRRLSTPCPGRPSWARSSRRAWRLDRHRGSRRDLCAAQPAVGDEPAPAAPAVRGARSVGPIRRLLVRDDRRTRLRAARGRLLRFAPGILPALSGPDGASDSHRPPSARGRPDRVECLPPGGARLLVALLSSSIGTSRWRGARFGFTCCSRAACFCRGPIPSR